MVLLGSKYNKVWENFLYSCCSLLNKSEFPWQSKNRNCPGILACTNLPVMIYRYRYRYGEREGVEERETLLTLMMG